MKINSPTKLAPQALGPGGHLDKMRASQANIMGLKQQRIDLDHKIKTLELRRSGRKASAPKLQGRVK